MRRLACLGSALMLSGCAGAANFLDDTHNASLHVNRPVGNSEVMRQVDGHPMTVAPLEADRGDIWPGPIKPVPTLEEVGRLPVPTLEGAATPQRSSVPNLVVPAIPHHLQPRPGDDGGVLTGPLIGGYSPAIGDRLPAPQGPTGPVTPSSKGPVVDTRRPSGIPPAGTGPAPSGVTVPNSDGTSTVIEPDGSIRTIPPSR